MNKNTKGIIAVAVVVLLGFIAYKKLAKPNSKKVVINYLNATFGFKKENADFVNSADKGYIDNWSNALKNGSDTFEFNGKTYNTKFGTAKQ
jgi:hypothetical protein